MQDKDVDFLFLHVPKLSSYYKPVDDFMFINFIPMGVFALCDTLNKNGINSCIKHMGLERILDSSFSVTRWIKENKIKVVGMSLHWHYQSFDVIDLAGKIKKENPETIIVLGGLTASRFSREILETFNEIDAVISGDADISITPFAEAALKGGSDFSAVPNCIWRSRSSIVDNGISFVAESSDLDSLDFANLQLLHHYEKYRDCIRIPMLWMNNADFNENMKRKVGAKKLFPLFIGRGCVVNCTFCGGGSNAQKKLCNRDKTVFRSVMSVADTMEKAIGYGYNGFILCFDPAPDDDSYYLQLMAEIRKRNLKCGFSFETWGLPTKEFIDSFSRTFILKDSYLGLSPETGSEEIRKKNKGIYYTNKQLFETLEFMSAKKVPAIIYLTMGLPDETLSQVKETSDFARRIRKRFSKILAGVFCFPVQIEPASQIFEAPDKYGIISNRSNFMDFYNSHKKVYTGSSSFTGFEYASKSISNNVDEFTGVLLKERCKNYCLFTPRIFGIELGFMSKFICSRMHARWKSKGCGMPAEVRKTFN